MGEEKFECDNLENVFQMLMDFKNEGKITISNSSLDNF